jgi:hypothetical protein
VLYCVVPSSPIFVTLMKEAPGSSETLVLTRATGRNNPEGTIPLQTEFVCLIKRHFAKTCRRKGHAAILPLNPMQWVAREWSVLHTGSYNNVSTAATLAWVTDQGNCISNKEIPTTNKQTNSGAERYSRGHLLCNHSMFPSI